MSMEKVTRRFAVVLAIGLAALLSLGIAATAKASPLHKTGTTASAAGTWTNYKDSTGDKDETLVLSSNGRATFSSGCAGLWSQVGKSVGIALSPSTCEGELWEFTGVLKNSGNLLSGSGRLIEGSSVDSFTWSATR
jgi:hypothetical protein